jgi:hypothetical protein
MPSEAMKGPSLINTDFGSMRGVIQGESALNNPTAREHTAHISGVNEQKEYTTAFPKTSGKATGHAGN